MSEGPVQMVARELYERLPLWARGFYTDDRDRDCVTFEMGVLGARLRVTVECVEARTITRLVHTADRQVWEWEHGLRTVGAEPKPTPRGLSGDSA